MISYDLERKSVHLPFLLRAGQTLQLRKQPEAGGRKKNMTLVAWGTQSHGWFGGNDTSNSHKRSHCTSESAAMLTGFPFRLATCYYVPVDNTWQSMVFGINYSYSRARRQRHFNIQGHQKVTAGSKSIIRIAYTSQEVLCNELLLVDSQQALKISVLWVRRISPGSRDRSDVVRMIICAVITR